MRRCHGLDRLAIDVDGNYVTASQGKTADDVDFSVE